MTDVTSIRQDIESMVAEWGVDWLSIKPAEATNEIEQLFARAIAALPVQVPAGWKMVPVESTEEMRAAGRRLNHPRDEEIYATYVAASPPAPASQVLTEGEQAAVSNLHEHQEQCDMDGVMVKVSRQAVDEVLAIIDRIINKDAEPHHPQGRNERT